MMQTFYPIPRGILVFVPRLATLGDLISTLATAHVFLLNTSNDVPVKIFSFHPPLISSWLLLPETKRLVSFFILNHDVNRQAGHVVFIQ
jgi:hypothetical protein